MTERAVNTNWGVVLIIIGVLAILVSVAYMIMNGSFTKCNSEILEKVKNTFIRPEFNETIRSESVSTVEGISFLENKSVTNIQWTISSRGDNGCTVAVNSIINGEPVRSPVFYVDLETQTISPDDEWASLVFIKAQYSLDNNGLLPLGP